MNSPMSEGNSTRDSAAHLPQANARISLNLYVILVCLVGAAGGFLFGFDTSVISGVIEYISSPRVFNLAALEQIGRAHV